MTRTTFTPQRWIAATAKIVLASGAIAAGAMTLSPAAQADAQFDAFKQTCLTNPGAYVNGAARGDYHEQIVPGKEIDQICSLYGPPKFMVVLGQRVEMLNSAKYLGDYTRQSYAQTQPGQVHPGVLR
jgi:hypothetical protein